MQTKKPTVLCCTAAAARLLNLRKVELRELAHLLGPRIMIADDDGSFWLWPIISEEVDSNSPCL